ncbi:HPr kinase/phosphorylase [Ancylobacter lacus]|uniref:HPr kinase/phosphorylase n=1 Tax=Ancylobacter lacus TaxID=2579970 RepID=UPI001BCCB15A|nr:hypothetical protein [Ancylobacter lacus]MBS7538158.1 hypothetical protein [Ancylobacter lacus]
MTSDSYLCGWRVRSELPLPELAPWVGDDRAPDIHVRRGAVPDRLEGAVQDSPYLQVDPRGACRLDLPAVATFHVDGPDRVVVAPHPEADPVEIRLFLLGSVLGYLCHLRGLLPLHASCVAIEGRALAFCGVSGAGKSTTALHLARRGHLLLADDVCVVDTRATPMALPAFPRLKLWQDSLRSAGIAESGLERNRPGQNKYHYRRPEDFATTPLPLAAVFLLGRAGPGVPPGIVRLSSPIEIVPALDREVFRRETAQQLGRAASLFLAQSAIAAATPVYRLTRRFDLGGMDEWLDAVEAVARG